MSIFQSDDDLSRSSCPEVYCKGGVLENIAKFTGKHLCQSFSFRSEIEIKTDDYLLFYAFFLSSHQVETKVAKCKPVANIYDGALNTFVCENIIQNFVSVY